MSDYLFLVPLSIVMGLVGLAAFLWTLRKEQYDDLDGAAYRILENDDFPLASKAASIRSDAQSDQQSNAQSDQPLGE